MNELNDIEEMLGNNKFYLSSIHGDVIDEWMEQENAGPLLFHLPASIMNEEFEEELSNRYPDITIYSILANESSDPIYIIFLFKQHFYKIGLFGDIITPEQFQETLLKIRDDLE